MAKRYIIPGIVLMSFMLLVSLGMSQLLFSGKGMSKSNVTDTKSQHQPQHQPQPQPQHQPQHQTTMQTSVIKLPAPSLKGVVTVEESLQKRRSVRSYKDTPLSLEQVSQVLWSAYGISDSTTYSKRWLRTAPSAGATYPLEIYLMAGNVRGLDPGLYRYIPDQNAITLYSSGDIRKDVAEACLGQKMLAQAPASLIYTAVYPRITGRYGERGADRYLCMDIGHSAQNVYLQTTAMGLATCAVGAFNDEQLDDIIKVPAGEKVLYLLPFGEKQ